MDDERLRRGAPRATASTPQFSSRRARAWTRRSRRRTRFATPRPPPAHGRAQGSRYRARGKLRRTSAHTRAGRGGTPRMPVVWGRRLGRRRPGAGAPRGRPVASADGERGDGGGVPVCRVPLRPAPCRHTADGAWSCCRLRSTRARGARRKATASVERELEIDDAAPAVPRETDVAAAREIVWDVLTDERARQVRAGRAADSAPPESNARYVDREAR